VFQLDLHYIKLSSTRKLTWLEEDVEVFQSLQTFSKSGTEVKERKLSCVAVYWHELGRYWTVFITKYTGRLEKITFSEVAWEAEKHPPMHFNDVTDSYSSWDASKHHFIAGFFIEDPYFFKAAHVEDAIFNQQRNIEFASKRLPKDVF
jgi:hypothetical protein